MRVCENSFVGSFQVFVSIFFWASLSCLAWATNPDYEPTADEVIQWWNKKERIGINRTVPIILTNGEKAFLSEVEFKQRGRNFMSGGLITRPLLKKTKDIDILGSDFEVMDLDGDGISEIISTQTASGQGTEWYCKTIIHLDGWKPVVLKSREYGNNLGDCGPESAKIFKRSKSDPRYWCTSEEVVWTWIDIDGDGIIDLVETVKTGKGGDSLKYKTVTTKYLFKKGKFVKDVNDKLNSTTISR
jgi:hypothetical protein